MKRNTYTQVRANGARGFRNRVEQEQVIIPPIPENSSYDEWNEENGSGSDNENSLSQPKVTEVVGPGLIYDETRNKYMDGLKLKINTTRSVSMHLANFDDQGYVYLTPATRENEKDMKSLKRTLMLIFGAKSLVTENNKICNFQELVVGEIVVAKIIISVKFNKFEFVRGRVIRIAAEAQEATIVDVDTMAEYNVPSHFLYRAFKAIMTLPFQAIQCRLQGFGFFEGTDVLKRLGQSMQRSLPCGFSCTIDSSEDIPTVTIGKNFSVEMFRHLGTSMGAKYRLVSGMYQAYISSIDGKGNIWLQYSEDRYVLDKLKSLLQESAPVFEKSVQEAPLTLETIRKGTKYLTRLSKNNFKRVIVRLVDLDGYYAKTLTQTDHKRVLVECVDFGKQFWVAEDELTLLEKFPSLTRNIPDMSQRVRLVGVKSFSKDVQAHHFCGRNFNVEIINTWPNDSHPVEVKMTFAQDAEDAEKTDLAEILKGDPGTVFYTTKEMEEIQNRLYAEWKSKNSESLMKEESALEQVGLKNIPPFVLKQIMDSRKRKEERKAKKNGGNRN